MDMGRGHCLAEGTEELPVSRVGSEIRQRDEAFEDPRIASGLGQLQILVVELRGDRNCHEIDQSRIVLGRIRDPHSDGATEQEFRGQVAELVDQDDLRPDRGRRGRDQVPGRGDLFGRIGGKTAVGGIEDSGAGAGGSGEPNLTEEEHALGPGLHQLDLLAVTRVERGDVDRDGVDHVEIHIARGIEHPQPRHIPLEDLGGGLPDLVDELDAAGHVPRRGGRGRVAERIVVCRDDLVAEIHLEQAVGLVQELLLQRDGALEDPGGGSGLHQDQILAVAGLAREEVDRRDIERAGLVEVVVLDPNVDRRGHRVGRSLVAELVEQPEPRAQGGGGGRGSVEAVEIRGVDRVEPMRRAGILRRFQHSVASGRSPQGKIDRTLEHGAEVGRLGGVEGLDITCQGRGDLHRDLVGKRVLIGVLIENPDPRPGALEENRGRAALVVQDERAALLHTHADLRGGQAIAIGVIDYPGIARHGIGRIVRQPFESAGVETGLAEMDLDPGARTTAAAVDLEGQAVDEALVVGQLVEHSEPRPLEKSEGRPLLPFFVDEGEPRADQVDIGTGRGIGSL